MTLQQKRRLVLVCIFIFAAFLIWIGLDGWTVKTMPAHWLGFIVAGIGVAGALGLNIWYGGPLDLRLDQKPDQSASGTKGG